MKIISFTVYELLNGAHIAFYLRLLKEARKCAAIVENAKHELDALQAAYDVEDEIMLRMRKNPYTELITEQDALRDRLWSLVYYVVKSSRELPDATVAKAANELFDVMKAHGNIPAMQYDRETGMMHNLCQDLQDGFRQQVETLRLTETVENMRAANEAFDNLLADRTGSEAGFMKNELAAARKSTDAAYYQFVEVANALSVLAEKQVGAQKNPYREFVEWVNADIVRLKRQALKQRARTESAEPTEPSESGWIDPNDPTDPDYPTNPGETETPPSTEPETPETPENPDPETPETPEPETPSTEEKPEVTKYTMTYKYKNGTVIAVQEYAPGEKIVPPEPPEGYHWGTYPETMPERNSGAWAIPDSYDDDIF